MLESDHEVTEGCVIRHSDGGRGLASAAGIEDMKFFSFWRSLASLRVRIALNLKPGNDRR